MSRLPLARRSALIGTALAGALVVAGCGEKSEMSDVANPPSTTATKAATTQAAEKKVAGPAQTINVSSPASGALEFEPKALSAKAGEITIDYKNPSPVPHNVEILGADGKAVGTEMQPFANGEGKTTAALEPGTYKFICAVPGHEQGGMVGELTVS